MYKMDTVIDYCANPVCNQTVHQSGGTVTTELGLECCGIACAKVCDRRGMTEKPMREEPVKKQPPLGW